MLRAGDPAPEFTAMTSSGKELTLSSLRGRRVVLFFFPKAFTTGCTIETRRFRDNYAEIAALGAEVIGVSVDKENVQCDFANKEGVPFPMIGDDSRRINRSYDVLWPLLNVSQRVTYIIGPDGRIEAVLHHELLVNKHLDEVKRHLQKRAADGVRS
jgi:peroxiredoxin Q/BCP